MPSLSEYLAKAQASSGAMIPSPSGSSTVHVKRQEQKVWVVTYDEMTCPVCAPMDGVKVPVGESFPV